LGPSPQQLKKKKKRKARSSGDSHQDLPKSKQQRISKFCMQQNEEVSVFETSQSAVPDITESGSTSPVTMAFSTPYLVTDATQSMGKDEQDTLLLQIFSKVECLDSIKHDFAQLTKNHLNYHKIKFKVC
jgi:hypothetical protein